MQRQNATVPVYVAIFGLEANNSFIVTIQSGELFACACMGCVYNIIHACCVIMCRRRKAGNNDSLFACCFSLLF